MNAKAIIQPLKNKDVTKKTKSLWIKKNKRKKKKYVAKI